MFITSLITFALSTVSFHISAKLTDDIERLLVRLIALCLLFASLAFAPLSIQLLIVIALLITAKKTHKLNPDNSVLDTTRKSR
ncbi:hypothetical protein H6G33_32700 [Calothrix sp. FACHB-1219]|uniref:hypothetical protein n=1 Tax=unclassified Calothrix TaxID=2619626 RepID=UPI00168843A5|nr:MULTISPECIES: hypothetical protein [unclassified Calothrix]MBD2202651.1 hypothetical protein [Calothrix sp. FACHB-168]MBD2221719.1 hypothetical protein [Calothrix sp. FACHB-1219]